MTKADWTGFLRRKTLRDSGLGLVKQGVTTVEEVFRTTVE